MVNGKVHAYHVDLTKRADVYRVADLVKKEVGKVRNDLLKTLLKSNRIQVFKKELKFNYLQVSILINNAGDLVLYIRTYYIFPYRISPFSNFFFLK